MSPIAPKKTHFWSDYGRLSRVNQSRTTYVLRAATLKADTLNISLSASVCQPGVHQECFHIQLTQHRHMPTSVELLPEDVLREIFKYSVPPPDVFSQGYMKEEQFKSRCILVLTYVCSRWRQIALSMPFLWSTTCASITDRVGGTFNLRGPNVEHFMHEWLRRAASVPRTLYIALGPSIDEHLIPINTILASYPFRRLSISDKQVELVPLIDLPNQALEYLEDLNLERSSFKFTHDAKLPNLRSLSITYLSRGFQRLSVVIPWAQLRHLTLSSFFVSPHLLFNVLKQCSYLEYCSIECLRSFDPPTPEPFFNITLPNLQSFKFHFFDCDLAVECLRRLAVPSVNTLLLSLTDVDTSIHSRFIERSDGMPHLRNITLVHWGDAPVNKGILLKQFPLLESITIRNRHLDECGSEMMEDLSTGRIGPHLKHLFIEGGSSVKASLDLLKNRYHNAMRSTRQHDGQVCQPTITHFQSATFEFYCDKPKFRDMIRDALESNGRSPYQCLRWVFSGELDRTCTLDNIED